MLRNESVLGISQQKQLLYVHQEINKIRKSKDFCDLVRFQTYEDDMKKFKVYIKVKDGPYEGIEFSFSCTIPLNYPAPGNKIEVICNTPIYHPNIHDGGSICVYEDVEGSLENGFKETLLNRITGLVYILRHPSNILDFDYTKKDIYTDELISKIKENIQNYKKRIILKKRMILKKTFGREINKSLQDIKDWDSYFPEGIIKSTNNRRYQVFTLNGRLKTVDYILINEALANLIHDQQVEFFEMEHQKFRKMVNGNKIGIRKHEMIIFPSNITYLNDLKSYVLIWNILPVKYSFIFTNIQIESNLEKFKICYYNPEGSIVIAESQNGKCYIESLAQIFRVNVSIVVDDINDIEKIKKSVFKIKMNEIKTFDENERYLTKGLIFETPLGDYINLDKTLDNIDGVDSDMEEEYGINKDPHREKITVYEKVSIDKIRQIEKSIVNKDVEKYIATNMDETGIDVRGL